MDKEKHIDNSIFISAISGVVLLLIAVMSRLLSIKLFGHTAIEAMLLPALPGILSAILLYTAIKRDKKRMQVHKNQARAVA